MFLVVVTNFFISSITKDYFKILFLSITLFLLIFEFGIDVNKSIYRKNILSTILIYILSYFLLSYLSGLFIGFNKTIYSFTLSNITKNILPTIIIIILSEFVRYEFVNKSDKNKIVLIFSCIIFILFDLSTAYSLYNFDIMDEVYEYIGLLAFGSVAKNIFLTVLCIHSDYLPCIVYRLFMELYIFIIPIVPAFGPYISSVIGILFPILLCVVVLNIIKRKIIEKPNKRVISKYINLVITIILIIIVLLNSGFFKYQMFTIGSNSMQTYMSKGDIILVKKLNNEEIKNIKKGQILVFRYKKKIISHRVYSIMQREDGTYYKTKGDNNAQVDDNIVKKQDIIGISVLRIKYLGIPSIKLQELFK